MREGVGAAGGWTAEGRGGKGWGETKRGAAGGEGKSACGGENEWEGRGESDAVGRGRQLWSGLGEGRRLLAHLREAVLVVGVIHQPLQRRVPRRPAVGTPACLELG